MLLLVHGGFRTQGAGSGWSVGCEDCCPPSLFRIDTVLPAGSLPFPLFLFFPLDMEIKVPESPSIQQQVEGFHGLPARPTKTHYPRALQLLE
ncbi:hypothetical protein CgunFtcFv8_002250 [Champsocephalus gunnari]|uniref:Uncharacterized protein n=1 Tax=Champsocephalus gunnari TaxID=52237 RepID=A0AAN8CQL4_CHAGU|nr:hypothetical protein CgunFtcFv8_002250 [Champsocephalus gunnari]